MNRVMCVQLPVTAGGEVIMSSARLHLRHRRRLTLTIIAILLAPFLASALDAFGIDVIPEAQAATGCKLNGPGTPDWGRSVIARNLSEDNGFGIFGEEEWHDEIIDGGDIRSLTRSFHTSLNLQNDSAIGLQINMTTGYRYTFCITLHPEANSPYANPPLADVYLLQDLDFSSYRNDYRSRNDDSGARDFLASLPVYWQGAILWHPFRDVHAYEGQNEFEFAVSLDHAEESWAIWDSAGTPRWMYLMIDGYDNIRDYDTPAPNRNFTAEVTVMVEERFALPNWTVSIVCCSVLLGMLVAPFILHSRYMKAGLTTEAETADLMPLLEQAPENPAQQQPDQQQPAAPQQGLPPPS